MISDFVYIEKLGQSFDKVLYRCSLPNPDPDDNEEMIGCGDIVVENCKTDGYNLSIIMFDNFKSLCIGDIYQRKHFVMTVIAVIEMHSTFDLSDANILLSDFLGVYEGTIADLDENAWV